MWCWSSKTHQFIMFKALVKCSLVIKNMMKLYLVQFRNSELRRYILNSIHFKIYNKFFRVFFKGDFCKEIICMLKI